MSTPKTHHVTRPFIERIGFIEHLLELRQLPNAGSISRTMGIIRKTSGEYQTFRAWMLSQANEMQRRILQTDKLWYTRHPAPRPILS